MKTCPIKNACIVVFCCDFNPAFEYSENYKFVILALFLCRAFREHQVTQSGLVDKLVTGKLGKQQFIDQDSVIAKKKDECIEKMEVIMTQLRSM